ncbi:serine/threonine-protein phosphatase [Geodermatophilus sp. YIM 151500]|uniref:PP2C family protein-serine/threonine phosphatase n=1 Tax=Geodermatophilus sp. YIM 151500 TaxID=2984531 RepID=UPI0021E4D752|nr:PP2C family protein-serine/threonine phosphatase [Geodermatophilus sp. YIM 151500]MCV2488139.1 serine/threonine-protein phosphatase [Geodermatophilus sp. YIM 151500]
MTSGPDGERTTTAGFSEPARTREENLGERLLGSLLDRAHLIPPRLVGPLVAQELTASGARDVAIWLQDYDQRMLRPVPGRGLAGESLAIDDSLPGEAFVTDDRVEEPLPDGSVRLYLPMLDGSDRVGVLGLTLPALDDVDRRIAQRAAGLVADLVVTKSMYTDTFAQIRTNQPMTVAAQLQWQTLPPLAMTTPDIDLAGAVEPAYEVGGDGFDYALDEHVLHLAVLDAMGHGLEAASMATVVTAAYRHGRRVGRSLTELYAEMDEVVARAFPGRFATAQFARLDSETGELSWVNAGHPPALWLRDRKVVGELLGRPTRPVGFGGATPRVHRVQLEPGDLLLFFTDGVVEERIGHGEQFGEARLREALEKTAAEQRSAAETVRRLSHALVDARRGRTSDDASLLLVQWKGPPRDDELARDVPESRPTGDGGLRS